MDRPLHIGHENVCTFSVEDFTMINVNDLHIEEEIKPLFDFSYNNYSGKEVKELLLTPLGSRQEIISRQELLQGFIANWELFKDYSYYRFNLSDTYDFFQSIFTSQEATKNLRLKFMFSEKAREQKRGKLILMVRLFFALNETYLSKIDINKFPKNYATEIEEIKKFFDAFDLEKYEIAFNKNKFGNSHMVELLEIISEKIVKGEVEVFWKQWFLFEAYLSVTNGIISQGFVFPSFDDNSFSLQGFFHPVLKTPVRNDFTAEKSVMLLTGPNMSGKSTMLKAVSICVYLAHIGLPVPAASAVMPFFNTISVAINLSDSIISGYSHFMTEIMTLKKVVIEAQSGSRCFAVFDELFRGTNIEDALEISTSTIRGLTGFNNSIFFISTHLHQLKEMQEIKDGRVYTCYIDSRLKENVPVFTYKLREGWNDLKLGRILFEKEGLDQLLQHAVANSENTEGK